MRAIIAFAHTKRGIVKVYTQASRSRHVMDGHPVYPVCSICRKQPGLYKRLWCADRCCAGCR